MECVPIFVTPRIGYINNIGIIGVQVISTGTRKPEYVYSSINGWSAPIFVLPPGIGTRTKKPEYVYSGAVVPVLNMTKTV